MWTVKYYKYLEVFGEPYDGSMTYLETVDGIAIRRLTILEDQTIFSSNVDFALGEGQVDYDHEEDVIPITQQEFEQVWKTHLDRHRTKWNETKEAFPVGIHVAGSIKMFFPQGTIINLSHGATGIADYSQCRASTRPEFMYPKSRITGIAQGYDEVNQWIIIGSPQVHEDVID